MNTRIKAETLELPKFRDLGEVKRYLVELEDQIAELDNLIKSQRSVLAFLKKPKYNVKAALIKAASSSFEITIDPDDNAKRTSLKRKIDPKLTKLIIPNLKKLEKQYGLSEELYEKHRILESLETQLSMQFPDKQSKPFNDALSSLRQLKSRVKEQLQEVLSFLNEVAAKHVPPSFERYMQAVVQEVEEHVAFKENDVFLYVSVNDQKRLVFTYYLMLVDALNDEGQITPHLYISVQWIVGLSVCVQINHEYELPTQLAKDPGTEVSSASEAIKAISSLLDIENFSTALGVVPLATQLKMDPLNIKESMFTYRSFIKAIKVESNKLIFELRSKITEEQIEEIKYPLYQEVKELFRRAPNAKLRMKLEPGVIEFNVVNGNDISYLDAEFLADKFNLNHAQLRKVVETLNNSKTSARLRV